MTDAIAKILTLVEAMELAKVFSESDLVPKEFKGKPANCVIAIKMGEEVGLSPFQALQSIAVFNGKPLIYGDAGLGIVMTAPDFDGIKEEDDGETATCTLGRKGYPPVTRTFSHADAQRIQMYERDGQGNLKVQPLANRVTWKNHPKRMRQWRARWWAMRDQFPDRLKGLRGVEEMEDATTIIDVTPGNVVTPADEYGGMEPKEQAHEADRGGDTERGSEPAAGAAVGVESGHPVQTTAPSKEPPKAGDEPAREPAPPQEATPAMTVPDPACVFELNGVAYQTAGITKDLLLETFKLVPQVNKKRGKKYAENLLKTEFGCASRKDLTEENAQKYIVRLNELLEAE